MFFQGMLQFLLIQGQQPDLVAIQGTGEVVGQRLPAGNRLWLGANRKHPQHQDSICRMTDWRNNSRTTHHGQADQQPDQDRSHLRRPPRSAECNLTTVAAGWFPTEPVHGGDCRRVRVLLLTGSMVRWAWCVLILMYQLSNDTKSRLLVKSGRYMDCTRDCQ